MCRSVKTAHYSTEYSELFDRLLFQGFELAVQEPEVRAPGRKISQERLPVIRRDIEWEDLAVVNSQTVQ